MNAELTWKVWRRILREEELQTCLFEHDFAERAHRFNLGEEERAIALAYAATPEQTRWAIETYRFRSVNVIVEALQVAAPLTTRLFERRGRNVEQLAQSYLASVEWKDQGPYTYGVCAAVLQFMDQVWGGSRDPELSDLIGFESATIRLLRRLAHQSLPTLEPQPEFADEERALSVIQTGRGLTFTTRFDLRPWLEDPELIGASELEEASLRFLRYVRSSAEEPALTTLSERGQRVFDLVCLPRSVEQICSQVAIDPDACRGLLRRFNTLAVVQCA